MTGAWNDAKKHKPPVNERVLVWAEPSDGRMWKKEDKHIFFDMMTSKKTWASGWDVRWWMPLPEPPEEER